MQPARFLSNYFGYSPTILLIRQLKWLKSNIELNSKNLNEQCTFPEFCMFLEEMKNYVESRPERLQLRLSKFEWHKNIQYCMHCWSRRCFMALKQRILNELHRHRWFSWHLKIYSWQLAICILRSNNCEELCRVPGSPFVKLSNNECPWISSCELL